jgi:ATP phosphoribosyltransferase regulatory subunit
MENNAILRAYKISNAIKKINNIFESYGFQKLYLPMYEYYDVLKDAVRDFSDENIIRFIDRVTGKSMVLRPDFTPQVCRCVANYMDSTPLPVRLYYNGRVFRNVRINQGLKSEKYQCGGEILGLTPFIGEIEILSIINECIKSLNLKDVHIIFGDMKLLDLILSQLAISHDEIIKILIRKELNTLEKFVGSMRYDNKLKELILFLPLAIGDTDILKELAFKANFNRNIVMRIEEVTSFFDMLKNNIKPAFNIIFDASELRGFNYYTGINYDIVFGDRGALLGGGGRYDNLMNIFGHNIPACGLAFDIDEIISCFEDKMTKKEIDYLVIGKQNINKLFELRKNQCSTIYIEDERELENFKSIYKFKNILK